MTKDDVYGDLGEVVAGVKTGRLSSDETFIFDSTGMALQDVIVAAAVYEKALAKSLGQGSRFWRRNRQYQRSDPSDRFIGCP